MVSLGFNSHGNKKGKEQKWNNIKPSIYKPDDNISRLSQSFLSHPTYSRSREYISNITSASMLHELNNTIN
jgi:hypothetical protein